MKCQELFKKISNKRRYEKFFNKKYSDTLYYFINNNLFDNQVYELKKERILNAINNRNTNDFIRSCKSNKFRWNIFWVD